MKSTIQTCLLAFVFLLAITVSRAQPSILEKGATINLTGNKIEFMKSANGRYIMVLEHDQLFMWDSQEQRMPIIRDFTGNSATNLKFQADGNVVVYNAANGALWASGTDGIQTTSLVLKDDGRLVLIGGASGTEEIWVFSNETRRVR